MEKLDSFAKALRGLGKKVWDKDGYIVRTHNLPIIKKPLGNNSSGFKYLLSNTSCLFCQ